MAAESKKQWADAPYELIPVSILGLKQGEKPKGSSSLAVEMIIVHNAILRGINAIYLQCVNVEKQAPQYIPDFVNYAHTWGKTLEEHHRTEETMLFAEIEELAGVPGLMKVNVDQHEAFHDGLETYLNYTEAILCGEDKYDGKRLKSIIESFMPVLREHLLDEIVTLTDLNKFDKVDWESWITRKQTEILAKAQVDPEMKYMYLPLILQCHDSTFGVGVIPKWPPMPWFAKLIVSWVFAPRHKAWWRFSPSDLNGKPRVLPYAS